MASTVLKRVVRRETHSARSAMTVIVLGLVVVASVYAGAEIVLHLLGAAPLLSAPGGALTWLREMPEHSNVMIVAGGLVAMAVGVVLLWLALGPGRKPKHELAHLAHAVIVDNGVIASSIAEQVRRELDLSRGAVVVGVGHRSADVSVRPEPGQVVDKSQVRGVAETALDAYRLSPAVKVRARVLQAADEEGAS